MNRTDNRAPEPVVLVPGLWLGGWSMGLIGRWMHDAGFATHPFSYPTVHNTLRESAHALRAFSDSVAGPAVHFVGHSLGGIVIRAMLAWYPPARPGRVVTLGSPHGGCHAATLFGASDWGRRMLGQGISDLLHGERLPCDFDGREIGIVKGDLSFGFGRLLFTLPQPNDGVISAEEADLPGAADSVTLPVAHSGMLCSYDVVRQACAFLRRGRFDR